MKTRNVISIIAIVAIITIGFIACDGGDEETHTHTWGAWQSDDARHWQECTAGDGAKTAEGSHTGNPCTVCGYETPHEPLPATITQTDGLAFNGTVTISTSHLYLNADWEEVVASVITALNAAYTAGPPPAKNQFGLVFGGNGVEIVLVDNLADDKNWEVRAGEFRTLYLKTGSIATATYATAVQSMDANNPNVGKASPAKGGVFLAQAHKAADTVSKSNQLYC
jgi:hypothetical protein